jgi:hypothetical protein
LVGLGSGTLTHQFPPMVSASPKVQGPHSPVTGTIGRAPQLLQVRVQSGAVASFLASGVSATLVRLAAVCFVLWRRLMA